MANTYTGSDAGQAGLNITEVDGSPNVSGVSKIIVSNGTLTDDGAGSVTITTGGGGGGTVTSVSVSGGFTGLTVTGSPITTSGTITIAGTLAIANGGTGATTDSTARAALGAAASGDNSDITKLSGLTTALSPSQGGTGATTLTDGGIPIMVVQSPSKSRMQSSSCVLLLNQVQRRSRLEPLNLLCIVGVVACSV